MIIVYTKAKQPREIFNTILTRTEAEQSGGLFIDHPELREEDCIVVEADKPFENPISDDLISVREMTREELILIKNKIELLAAGEYVENGVIKTIEKPLDLIRPIWNKELREWQEGTTKEELMLRRVDLIMEYNDLKNKITTLEELREFESAETIELLREKMNKIKKEADMLLEKIKKLK